MRTSQFENYLSSQLAFTESELQDTIKPNVLLSEMAQLILQMLIEYTDYIAKNKETEKNKASKKRLLRLLDITTDLNGSGDLLYTYKLKNRILFSNTVHLKEDIEKLQGEVDGYKKMFEDL